MQAFFCLGFFQGDQSAQRNANNLLGSVISIAGAVAAKEIGNTNLVDGSPTKIAAHALLGELKSMAMGGDFQTGALAGGANEALVQYLAKLVLPDNYKPNMPGSQQAQVNLLAMSQLMGVLAAVVTGGDPEIAAGIAANATQYNYLSHSDLERASKEILGCGNDTSCAEEGYAKYHKLSMEQTAQALIECGNDPKTCSNVSMLVAKAEADTARFKNMADGASPAVAKVLNLLIAENYGFQNELAGVTAGHSAEAVADVLVQKFGITPERAAAFVAGVIVTVAAINAAKSGGGAKGIDKIFETGRAPKASELKEYAEAQGWKPSQTDGGPLKYVDENGIPRVTIKQGSSRAPGSSDPHVEFKDATGQRTDAFGNPVTRKSPGNHTPIDFDL